MLNPRSKGLKSIILVSKMVSSLFSELKPGAIKETSRGVKINKKSKTIIRINKKILNKLARKSQASFFERVRHWLKTGTMAAEMAPIIKTIEIKSGILKAA